MKLRSCILIGSLGRTWAGQCRPLPFSLTCCRQVKFTHVDDTGVTTASDSEDTRNTWDDSGKGVLFQNDDVNSPYIWTMQSSPNIANEAVYVRSDQQYTLFYQVRAGNLHDDGTELGWYIQDTSTLTDSDLNGINTFIPSYQNTPFYAQDESRVFFTTQQRCPNQIPAPWQLSIEADKTFHVLQNSIGIQLRLDCEDSAQISTVTVSKLYGIISGSSGCNKYGISEETISSITDSYDDMFSAYDISYDVLEDVGKAPWLWIIMAWHIASILLLGILAVFHVYTSATRQTQGSSMGRSIKSVME